MIPLILAIAGATSIIRNIQAGSSLRSSPASFQSASRLY